MIPQFQKPNATQAPERKRLLIVDDEPMLLEGLQGRMRRYRHLWLTHFVTSGQEALEEMANNSYDMIIADVYMPGMDGIELLSIIREKFPNVVRIAVSGTGKDNASLRAAPVAHQFLAKPFEIDQLVEIVDNTYLFVTMIEHVHFREALGRIGKLPPMPKITSQLQDEISSSSVNAKRVADIVKMDIALTTQILRLVNSPFFGFRRKILDIQQAVALLGYDFLRQLVLTFEIESTFKIASYPTIFSLERLQQHSRLTAFITKEIFKEYNRPEEAFAAGLLHDIGILISLSAMPQDYSNVVEYLKTTNKTLYEAEYDELGLCHAEFGGYLLGLWGVPIPLSLSVCYHHQPWNLPHDTFDLVDAVYLADAIALEVAAAPFKGGLEAVPLDMNYLEHLGVKDRVAGWIEFAKNLLVNQGY